VLWGARRYALDGHLQGTWLTMRWLTGLLGLGSIAAVMTYPGRKTDLHAARRSTSHWKLAHAYLGLIAGYCAAHTRRS